MAKTNSPTPNHSDLEFALDAETLARVVEITEATKPHLFSQADAEMRITTAERLLRVMTVMDGLSALSLTIRAAVPEGERGMVGDLTTMAEDTRALARDLLAAGQLSTDVGKLEKLTAEYADALGYGKFILGLVSQAPLLI